MFAEKEIIVAGKPGRKIGYPLEVVSESVLRGGAESKRKLELMAGDGFRRRLTMVVKETVVNGLSDKEIFASGFTHSGHFYYTWMMLKSVGIPTVPTVRIIDDRKVLMTDLTADGSMFFGKATKVTDNRANNICEMEFIFSQIDLVPVYEELKRVERIAMRNDIILPIDDPFDLLLHPDGSWEVMVLDLGWTMKLDGLHLKYTADSDLYEAKSFFKSLCFKQERFRMVMRGESVG